MVGSWHIGDLADRESSRGVQLLRKRKTAAPLKQEHSQTNSYGFQKLLPGFLYRWFLGSMTRKHLRRSRKRPLSRTFGSPKRSLPPERVKAWIDLVKNEENTICSRESFGFSLSGPLGPHTKKNMYPQIPRFDMVLDRARVDTAP